MPTYSSAGKLAPSQMRRLGDVMETECVAALLESGGI